VHQLILADEFERAGIALLFVLSPQADKSLEGQLLTNVQGVVAEYEREKLLERTKRGLLTRAKAGHVGGGGVPLGYCRVEDHFETDDDEASLIRRIYAMYTEGGMSCRAIAKRLTQERVPTQRDRRGNGPPRKLKSGIWHPTTVNDILASETYVGRLYHNKTERLDGLNGRGRKSRTRLRPRDAWIAIAVTPIIDHHVWHAAQAQRERNAALSPRNRKREYLLTGLVVCGVCNYHMHGQTDIRYDRRTYRCTRPRYQSMYSCRGAAEAGALEAEVWQAVERALRNPALIATEVAKRHGSATTLQEGIDRDKEAVERQIARCDHDLKRWDAAYEVEAITVNDLKEKRADIAARRHACEQELARLQEQQSDLNHDVLQTASLTAYCQAVVLNLGTLSYAEKRTALHALSIVVVWERGKPIAISGSIPRSIEEVALRRRHTPNCVT